MAAEQDGGEKTPMTAPCRCRGFRWLYVARLAVASAVSIIAVAVIIRAVVVLLRPEKLQLRLAEGRVAVDYISSLPPPGNTVTFRFLLRASNPSGRASVVYTNVTIRLTDVSVPRAIAGFDLGKTMVVSQRTTREATVKVGLTPAEDLPMAYVRSLFEGRSVGGVEMEVSGVLATRVAVARGGGVASTTSAAASYYRWPVTIAVVDDGEAEAALLQASDYSAHDTACLDKSEAPAIA
ncbi:uncharacterized protein LOC100842511 [Brachypodium distachyon]|uniref:Late embryogenesis abundant protein LEA-2 subgroup domain-containing protein n=1 Tax=Brachypodium distachyon TaxID=15368 RepID=A0A2K2DQK1_BRADI|nr:uncharacterized protein LOC100842511 [Brachypodium distachyon]PNT76554.1 hypothetical protein BRADI_1g49370v3 [Brachypodium distachyon]|eukprot:XP_003561104.2 uncharacterized protein LOC100842511 [Brachypodium distachyon]